MGLFVRLFGWLRARRAKRNRAIFSYWDGQRMQSADPMVIWRLIDGDPEFSLEKHGTLLEAGDSESAALAVAAVHRAFAVKPFHEGGLLETECLDLLAAFFEYLDSLKKSTDPSPISSAPTESGSSDQDQSPTKSSSDCGKTPSEAN